MTLFEMLAVIACVVIVGALLLTTFVASKGRAARISCRSKLKEINVCFRVWAEDNNNNQYPMSVSVTNGGGMELIRSGNLVGCLQFASNEMSSTKMFVCPDDPDRTFATNWNDLNHLHVSYFLSADASNVDEPAIVFSGDDNLAIGSQRVQSGLLNLSSNAPISWLGTRHTFGGNILYADGSFDQVSAVGLQQAFQGTGLATNRIVLP